MISPTDLVFGPVILPLMGAAVCFLAKAFFQGTVARVAEYISIAAGLLLPWAVLALLAPLMIGGEVIQGVIGRWHEGVGIMYRFDGLAWTVNILGFSVAGASWIYSLGSGPRGPAFSGIFLIQTAALAATMMTADLFNLFVCLEILGISSYVLVAWSEKPGAALAAFSYLMLSSAAMVFFLVGLLGFYRLTGTLSYEGIREILGRLPDNGGLTANLSLALIIAAVAMRVAVMPLYGWLPDAHAMAPHPVSAVLSGVLIKTPLFALSRILVLVPAGMRAGELMSYAGAFTALAAVVIALSQTDAKRLLAYHSISQIGYIVSVWGAAIRSGMETPGGRVLMTAAYLHAFYHALFKGLLFLSVGTTVDRCGQRNVYQLRNAGRILKASGERVPVTMLTFTIGALAISAIPPLNGYISKTAINAALKGSPHYGFLYVAGIGTVASFIKLSRIFWPSTEHKNEETSPSMDTGARPSKPSVPQWISQIILALLCLAGGLAGKPVYRLVGLALSAGSGIPSEPVFYSTGTLLKTLITLAAGAILFLVAGTRQGKAVLRLIRERPRSFRGLFTSFAFGTAAMALWLTL